MKKAARYIMSQRERHQMNTLLQEVLTAHDDGNFSYAPGWSDQRVADKIKADSGAPIHTGHAQQQRTAVFGKLRNAPASKNAALESRVALLEQQLKALCDAMGYEFKPA